jgi:hypothetical protein
LTTAVAPLFILGLFFFVLNSFERLLDIFCCLKLGSRRRAIKIAYYPWQYGKILPRQQPIKLRDSSKQMLAI